MPLFAGVTEKAVAEQIAAGVISVIAGLGLTVTTMVKVAPTQFPAAPEVGVTV